MMAIIIIGLITTFYYLEHYMALSDETLVNMNDKLYALIIKNIKHSIHQRL